MKRLLPIACLFLCCAASTAATHQDRASLKAVVESFVRQQTAGLPGRVSFNMDETDPTPDLRTCSKIEAFFPAGGQLMGRTSISVRCTDKNVPGMSVPVQIRVSRDLIISAYSLSRDQVIRREDLSRLSTEDMQNTGITDETQVVGKVLRYNITAGLKLMPSMLRAPYVVKFGQTVPLSVQGIGFKISSSGIAQKDAAEGETVQVLISKGRLVSGVAGADGVVRINP